MRPIRGYNEAQAAGEFERLPVGGYVIRITDVKDEAAKSYLTITYDIAEGQYKDFYKSTDADHVKSHQFIRSYKETALGMLKGFIMAIDDTNGTKFGEGVEVRGLDERLLIGKLLGVVIGEEEYENNQGEVKTVLKVRSCLDAEKIRKGQYKMPELKKLKEQPKAPAGFTQFNDDDIPFA